LLAAGNTSASRQAVRRINSALDSVNLAIKAIDPCLAVQAQQKCAVNEEYIQLIITCNFHREAVHEVMALVEAAPALPPRLRVCAFKPPLAAQALAEKGRVEIAGCKLDLNAIRLQMVPAKHKPGVFDLICFVPPGMQTEFDDGAPGAMAAHLALRLALGEYKLLACTDRISVVMTRDMPPKTLPACELADLLGGQAA
jgi:hypothetical protein